MYGREKYSPAAGGRGSSSTRALSGAGAIAAVALALSGCAGNGQGLDENGRPDSGSPSPLTADFESIQENVFTPICSVCHAGAAAPLGFRLDADSSYAMLVNTASVEVPSLSRVEPGDPDSSYVVQKIEGHAAVGSQMPLGGPPLPQATIDVIRQWISDGAQPAASANAAATAHRAIRLRAIAPLSGESLAQAPREILIAADGELDTTLLSTAGIRLERASTPTPTGAIGAMAAQAAPAAQVATAAPAAPATVGADALAADAHTAPPLANTPFTITVHSLSPTVFALIPRGAPWVDGTYRLTLPATGPMPLAGRDGRRIESDLVLDFTVEPAP